MSKQINMTVQGKAVNSAVISAFATRLNNLEAVVSVWANAAALQAANHNNRNWLDSLFNAAPMRLKSGELSVLGKQVFKYIEAHFPRVVWDKDSQKVGLKKFQAESPLATCFIAVGATEESDTIHMMGSKFYKAQGDFHLTFAEFKSLEKPVKESTETEASMTAKAFVKQAEKALECFKNERLVGTADELLAASLRAKELYLALDAAFTKAEASKNAKAAESGIAATPADAIDVALADQLLKSGQNGKSKRAGGKVQDKVAA